MLVSDAYKAHGDGRLIVVKIGFKSSEKPMASLYLSP